MRPVHAGPLPLGEARIAWRFRQVRDVSRAYAFVDGEKFIKKDSQRPAVKNNMMKRIKQCMAGILKLIERAARQGAGSQGKTGRSFFFHGFPKRFLPLCAVGGTHVDHAQGALFRINMLQFRRAVRRGGEDTCEAFMPGNDRKPCLPESPMIQASCNFKAEWDIVERIFRGETIHEPEALLSKGKPVCAFILRDHFPRRRIMRFGRTFFSGGLFLRVDGSREGSQFLKGQSPQIFPGYGHVEPPWREGKRR